jgi:hypothetical protein
MMETELWQEQVENGTIYNIALKRSGHNAALIELVAD